MDQYRKTQTDLGTSNSTFSIGKILIFLFSFLLVFPAFGQKPDKVQKAIDAIKAANYCEDQDYHTDGQRVIWVKSYKKWTPDDWVVIKKEDPGMLKFFAQAIQRGRFDVLEQLLPNYYRERGGVKAFAADIIRNQPTTQSADRKNAS